ncbi:MAG: DUF4338 domain-containing protein, partial [Thermodesulfobacteriota bacterium]|nr:DUF4338 domain-containing protein [Thermodesulfobacteriota bacterium]
MKELLSIRGRIITDTDIGLICSLTDEYGNRSRAFISRKLSESWKWYQANGRLKDRACRDILSVLEAKGLITLPPLSARGNRSQANHQPLGSAIKVDTSLIRGSVRGLKPFIFEMVSQSSLEPLWNHLISRYHYLGYKVLVGACLKYLVFSKDRIVAALGWSSAVWKLADRDIAIGWSVA